MATLEELEARLAVLEGSVTPQAGVTPLAAVPPIRIGEISDVPTPGSTIASAWAQEVTNRVRHRFANAAARDTNWPAAAAGKGAVSVTLDTMITWESNGVTWNTVGQTPPGAIEAYAGLTVPNGGWLLCDGAAVSRTTYAALFAVIGNQYGGGDGTSTFNVPNLRGRMVVMFDPGQAEFASLGQAFGSKTAALNGSHLPAHAHSVSIVTDNQGDHAHSSGNLYFDTDFQLAAAGSAFYAGKDPSQNLATTTNGAHAHNVNGNTSTVGSNAAFYTLPPTLALNYLIKI